MINTLYIPELREMLAEKNMAELGEFCTALHPARTAEFMEGLTAEEAWTVLGYADTATRIEIFGYFDEAKQIEIIESKDVPGDVLHYARKLPSGKEGSVVHVFLNFSKKAASFQNPVKGKKLLVSTTVVSNPFDGDTITLLPWEGIVLE